MDLLGGGGEVVPKLGLSQHTRDALANYTQLRWAHGRRKSIEREWGLTSDQARSVMEATASASTIDQIWKHKNGGWHVLLPVLGAVVGTSLDDFIRQERERVSNARREQEDRERQLVEMGRDLSAVLGLGPSGPRRMDNRRGE